MASPSAGAPALKYGEVNTETTSPGEVKGLITFFLKKMVNPVKNIRYFFKNNYLFKLLFVDIYLGN